MHHIKHGLQPEGCTLSMLMVMHIVQKYGSRETSETKLKDDRGRSDSLSIISATAQRLAD